MKSLYSKIILGFLASICISFSISGFFVLRRHNDEIATYTKNEIVNVSTVIMEHYEKSKAINKDVKSICDATSVSILCYDHSGLSEYIQKNDNMKFLHDKAKQFYMQEIDSIDLTNGNYQVLGVRGPNNEYVMLFEKNMIGQSAIFQHSALLALGFIFLSGSIVFLIVSDIIVKPLSRLSLVTKELAKGNYNVRMRYTGNDEIGKLSANFNYLASQLSKTEQTRQRFISDISHEFQTPLTSIQGFASILKNEELNPKQKEKYADIIFFEAQRLSNLSKSMLQLTLLDGEDVKLDLSLYSLNFQISRVLESLKESAAKKNIEINFEEPKKDIMLEADENRMEQVWINIVNNAIKYTNDDGNIDVFIKKNSNTVEVIVADTGIGMSEHALRHAFERFYREDKARSIGGNGLGLPIVKSIVELHKGQIDIQSQKDVGTEFHIILPLKQKK